MPSTDEIESTTGSGQINMGNIVKWEQWGKTGQNSKDSASNNNI